VVPFGQLGRDALARIEALGWRLIELRPEVASLGLNRYRVTIGRVTGEQGVSLCGTDPDCLLEDAAGHARAATR